MPARRPTPRLRLLGFLGAPVLIVLFCLGLVSRNPAVFWNDDYQISILPVLADVARSWREGCWPLLSPYSWACGNLAGEYQYGTFSVFVNAVVVGVFAFWHTFPAQAAALSIIHLATLGTGAYLLARGRRLAVPLALVVALIAALNGWEIGWGATDWFGALAADAWLPWAWWAFEQAMRSDGNRSAQRLCWLLPVPFVYLVLTGGFPYTVVRLGLVTVWLAVHAGAHRRWRALWPLMIGWILALMLSAPAWLSLLETIRGSSRSGGAGIGNFSWMVPPSALPGLILPNWTVPWTDFSARPSLHSALELTGGLVPLAGLLAVMASRRWRAWRTLRWDLVLLAGTLALCLLPSPGMFRWSFRWLPLFHLVFALLGARALSIVRGGFPPALCATVLVAGAWLAMRLLGTANGDRVTWLLAPWTLAVTVAWLILTVIARHRGWVSWLPLPATFAILWIAFTHQYTNPGVPIYAIGPGLTKTAPLSPDRLYLSLYLEVDKNYNFDQTPPDFGSVLRPGSTGMFAGIHMINGYSPIMPPGVGREFSLETHGSIPIDVARGLLSKEAGPTSVLAQLGIDGIIIAWDFPIADTRFPTDDWEQTFTSAEGTVYQRRGCPLPSAAACTVNEGNPWPIVPVESSRLRAVADLPGAPAGRDLIVAFRRPYFPGYIADLDGMPLRVEPNASSLMPTVRVPAGRGGRLTLRYRPRAVVWGGTLAGLGLIGMAGVALAGRWRGF